jgi:hypothetical protein
MVNTFANQVNWRYHPIIFSIIKKGSKIPELQALALWIYSICVYHNISLYAQWIPKEENEQRK